jgi:CheY-specific phosphatase CheX
LPEVFLARFQRAATGATVHLTGLPAFRASIERDTVAATEQLFGLMLSSEVTMVPHGQSPLHRWPGTGVHAQIDLQTSEGTVISVLFRADGDSARAITSHLIGANPADVHQDDVVATSAEFINIIVGRLRNRLVEAGIQTQMQLPRTWVGENTGAMAVPDVTLEFDSHRLGVSVGLLLLLGNAQTPAPVGETPA